MFASLVSRLYSYKRFKYTLFGINLLKSELVCTGGGDTAGPLITITSSVNVTQAAVSVLETNATLLSVAVMFTYRYNEIGD